MTVICVYSMKNKHKILYPNLDSTMRLVPHNGSLPIPVPLDDGIETSDDDADCHDSAAKEDYLADDDSFKPQKFSQAELNDLVRDLSLSKDKAELLTARLKEKYLLKHGVRITYFRQRNVVLQTCFFVEGLLCFCGNIDGLFECLSHNHDPAEWRLFIDSSKRSLKAVLRHNGNLRSSIPIAHSVHLHESYENMEFYFAQSEIRTHDLSTASPLL
ncbi:uncharacterized protein LOC128248578 [Octopus bimaculoides]|uniref:uncharacterized protein LOC128248578 n=1 Tax=Octopus bimaculoides TaxID=37653 RepID=UPI0022E114A7|nr:uncharacterized protein LOC128248578 [Octopus bimaculoides]XP_052826094.1 uncharacterized protein LOC128248578 [Octopus bimaculoides]